MLSLLPLVIYWNADPEAFQIPFIQHSVRWYGLLFALGFLISQQIMLYIFKKEGRAEKEVEVLTVYLVVATVVGARVGHCLFYEPEVYLNDPLRIFMIWEGGLASHGGAIGILVALYLYSGSMKMRYLWILDRIVIVVAITGCCIRLGNLMNSEMVGTPTGVPWAFVFSQVDEVPRHPAQLYEAIYCLLLFGLLFCLWQQRKEKIAEGLLFGLFLTILFSLRFLDEFFKENQVDFENRIPLNMGQLLSIPFILTGIALLVRVYLRSGRPVPAR